MFRSLEIYGAYANEEVRRRRREEIKKAESHVTFIVELCARVQASSVANNLHRSSYNRT